MKMVKLCYSVHIFSLFLSGNQNIISMRELDVLIIYTIQKYLIAFQKVPWMKYHRGFHVQYVHVCSSPASETCICQQPRESCQNEMV